jgi:hypothetical protein
VFLAGENFVCQQFAGDEFGCLVSEFLDDVIGDAEGAICVFGDVLFVPVVVDEEFDWSGRLTQPSPGLKMAFSGTALASIPGVTAAISSGFSSLESYPTDFS